jgi:hypothetical protein
MLDRQGGILRYSMDIWRRLAKPGRAAPPSWATLILAVLLPLVVPIVAMVHQHHDGSAFVRNAFRVESARIQTPAGAPPPKKAAHGVADSDLCPICLTLAGAAHYIPPPLSTSLLPALFVVVLFVSFALAQALSPRSHRWRSRAPPSFSRI